MRKPGVDRRHGRRRRRVAGQVEAGHDAGLRLGGRVDRRVFHVDRVEDAVARVVGIEDDVDEPGREVALEGQLREQAGAPVGAVEIEISRERLGLLVEDVERPVQVVDEEAAAARLVAQEVDAGQLAARVLAVEVTGDRQLRVVGELQRRLGNGRRGRRRPSRRGGDRATRGRVRREGAQVVDDVPDLGVGDPPLPPGHHRRRDALPDGRVDLAVGRAVVELGVGQVGRLLAALLLDDRDDDAGLHRAFGSGAVTGGAVLVVRRLARGDRRRRRRNGVPQRRRARIRRLLREDDATQDQDGDQRQRRAYDVRMSCHAQGGGVSQRRLQGTRSRSAYVRASTRLTPADSRSHFDSSVASCFRPAFVSE